MAIPITRDEWLAAIGECDSQFDQSALTIRELATLLNKNPRTVRYMIPRLTLSGIIVKTHKRLNGQVVPAYQLKHHRKRNAQYTRAVRHGKIT